MANNNDVLLNDIGGTGFFALMADTLGRARSHPKPVASVPAAPAVPTTPSGFTAALRLMTESEARDYDTASFKQTSRYFGTYADVDSETAVARAKSAVWMMAGYVGAAVFLTGALRIVDGIANPLQTAVYAIAGALVALIAWRGAWRTLMNADAPSTLDTPPYDVKPLPEAADNVVTFAPALRDNCATVLR